MLPVPEDRRQLDHVAIVEPRRDTTYTLVARRGNRRDEASTGIRIITPGAPKIVELRANPIRVALGSTTAIEWNVENDPSSIVLTLEDGTNFADLPPRGSVIIRPPFSSFPSMTVSNEFGTTTRKVVVLVDQPGGPLIESFTSNAKAVPEGTSVDLRWTLFGARGSRLLQDGEVLLEDAGLVQGDIFAEPKYPSSVFALEAQNEGGVRTMTLEVFAHRVPRITAIGARPRIVPLGASSTLTWTVEDAQIINVSVGDVLLPGFPQTSGTDGTGTFQGTGTAMIDFPTTFVVTAASLAGAVTASIALDIAADVLDDEVEGELPTGGGTDFYFVTVPDAHSLRAFLTTGPNTCGADLSLRLLDLDENLLAEDASRTSRQCARFEPSTDARVLNLPGATYLLAVVGAVASPYQIILRLIPPGCGNLLLEPGEECDDGNQDPSDLCTTACTVARCGDGFVARTEECDDANSEAFDACSLSCTAREFVLVRGPNTFEMGAVSGLDTFDVPARTVTLTRPYWLGATEVSQEEYERVTGTSPSVNSDCGPSCPVENISWDDAITYLNQRSVQDGLPVCYMGTRATTASSASTAAAIDCPRRPNGSSWRGTGRPRCSRPATAARSTAGKRTRPSPTSPGIVRMRRRRARSPAA
ncbi:MAG: DUF4215 domain-containing protein [Myxococcales bacterium]|nr:DUF4215 domain-containing protein [Myxococcales bacterium]